MNRKDRIPKTRDRLLGDLDDHLFLLKEAFLLLRAGDEAYFKVLATELRTLVCLSSNTEGLLWRIVDKLRADDSVYIHSYGRFNLNHPLVIGLDFAEVPVYEGGQGDIRILPKKHSLKRIIKFHHAALVRGKPYTREEVIRASAQQIGSAHEDDGIDKYLIDLITTTFGELPSLYKILLCDAKLALTVGDNVLAAANLMSGYTKKIRRDISIPDINFDHPSDRSHDFEFTAEGLPKEGSIVLDLHLPNKNWINDNVTYHFPPHYIKKISIKCTKYFDREIEIIINGLTKKTIYVKSKIQSNEISNINVVITWNNINIKNLFKCCSCDRDKA